MLARLVPRAPHSWLLALVLVCLLPSFARAQQPSPSFEAASERFDARLLEQLAALDPDVREQWRAANEARDAGDDERAAELYGEVLDLQPEFDHALRRRCGVRMNQGRQNDAYTDCNAAYELQASPENAVVLAMVLSSATNARRDEQRARTLARFALHDAGADIPTYVAICEVALQLEDQALMDGCSARLRELDEQSWEAQLFTSFAAASRGQVDEARAALERAHDAGLDDALYEELDDSFVKMESPFVRYGRMAGWALLAWIGLAAALIVAGVALSRLTLAEANRALHDPAASAHAKESRLHRAYAAILWLCCGYYYVSVPLVLLSVVALGGAIVLGFLYIGHVPIKLLFLVVVLVGGTVFAVLKSFFARPNDAPPGEPLDLDEAPLLRQTLDEVAAKVGTRPVDEVYLEVGADIAVFERGGLLAKLRGQGQRCLLLGVAVLEGMDMQAFKAILAHEYGHFSNEDTAGGNFALAVRRSIVHSAQGLAELGAAAWYNPAWLFLNGFHKLFLRISQGASRLQEVLADRWAARSYGASSFERGLRHAIAVDLQFERHANAALQEVFESKGLLPNIYRYTTAEPAITASELEAKVEEAVDAEPSPYASHPRPADRFRWARAIAPRDPDEGSSEPAWTLFPDRASIEVRLTDELRSRVHMQTGVLILAEPRAEPKRRKRMPAAE